MYNWLYLMRFQSFTDLVSHGCNFNHILAYNLLIKPCTKKRRHSFTVTMFKLNFAFLNKKILLSYLANVLSFPDWLSVSFFLKLFFVSLSWTNCPCRTYKYMIFTIQLWQSQPSTTGSSASANLYLAIPAIQRNYQRNQSCHFHDIYWVSQKYEHIFFNNATKRLAFTSDLLSNLFNGVQRRGGGEGCNDTFTNNMMQAPVVDGYYSFVQKMTFNSMQKLHTFHLNESSKYLAGSFQVLLTLPPTPGKKTFTQIIFIQTYCLLISFNKC